MMDYDRIPAPSVREDVKAAAELVTRFHEYKRAVDRISDLLQRQHDDSIVNMMPVSSNDMNLMNVILFFLPPGSYVMVQNRLPSSVKIDFGLPMESFKRQFGEQEGVRLTIGEMLQEPLQTIANWVMPFGLTVHLCFDEREPDQILPWYKQQVALERRIISNLQSVCQFNDLPGLQKIG